MSEVPLYMAAQDLPRSGARPPEAYRGSSPIRKRPSPQDPLRTLGIGLRYGPRGTLGIGLRQGPRGLRFLVIRVPVYARSVLGVVEKGSNSAVRDTPIPQVAPSQHAHSVQGYLAHKKPPPSPGPP